MGVTRYWSVEECRWIDPPPVERPEDDLRLGDELSMLPRQRGLDELRQRPWEGVEA
jgi:hypothetical protein